ncbi:MAG: LuxR C-terminal-related transcriptional regulator [Bacillota bacterium]
MYKKKLLLLDGLPLFRQSLAQMFKSSDIFEVVGEAGNENEALKKALEVTPDLILMDLFVPSNHSLKFIQSIKEMLPETKVVILTKNEDGQYLYECLRCGAEGYLLKSMNFEGLTRCLEGCFEGELAIPKILAHKIFTGVQKPKGTNDKSRDRVLSRREKEVLQLVPHGMSNKEIGNCLVISESTVKKHLHHIMKKLSFNNRVQLVNYVLQETYLRNN